MLINLINFGSNENKFLDISDYNNLQLFINYYLVKDKVQECKNNSMILSCFNKKCATTLCVDDCTSCPVKNNSKNIKNFLDFKKSEKLLQYYTFSRIQPTNDHTLLTTTLTGGVQIFSHIFYTNLANILLITISGKDENVTTLCHKFDTILTPENIKDIQFFNELCNNGSDELMNIKNYVQKQNSYEANDEYLVQKDGLSFTQLVKLFKTIINDKQTSTTTSSSKKFVRNK